MSFEDTFNAMLEEWSKRPTHGHRCQLTLQKVNEMVAAGHSPRGRIVNNKFRPE